MYIYIYIILQFFKAREPLEHAFGKSCNVIVAHDPAEHACMYAQLSTYVLCVCTYARPRKWHDFILGCRDIVCMYYVYECVYSCVCACICVHTAYVCACIMCMYVCAHVSVHIQVLSLQTRAPLCLHACIACTCVCMLHGYVRTYVRMHACMQVCIYV